MKIVTYNVNGINARLPVLLRSLAESRPDVACLQEPKRTDAMVQALLEEYFQLDISWEQTILRP